MSEQRTPYGDQPPPPPSTRISEKELIALEGTFAPSVYRLAQEIRRYRAVLLGLIGAFERNRPERCPSCRARLDSIPELHFGGCTWEDLEAELAAIRAERPKAPKP